MSIHSDLGLEAKKSFGGILELDDGEREHCEASEPTEVLVPEIRKGDVLVAGMTTGDGYARDNERPFKVLATREFHDVSSKCIIDVVDMLDGEKGTLSLRIPHHHPCAASQIHHSKSCATFTRSIIEQSASL